MPTLKKFINKKETLSRLLVSLSGSIVVSADLTSLMLYYFIIQLNSNGSWFHGFRDFFLKADS
jgi:hypothetical protein